MHTPVTRASSQDAGRKTITPFTVFVSGGGQAAERLGSQANNQKVAGSIPGHLGRAK